MHVLVITRGIPALFRDEEIRTTRRELAKAHQLLRVESTRFLDFPAPKLDVVPAHQLADAIRAVITELRPDTVYIPHYGDIHSDHRAAYEAGLVAARPVDGCSITRIFSYETLSETEWSPPLPGCAFIPNVFVDISPYLELKIQAMACYCSQLRDFPHSRSLVSLRALAAVRGSSVGLEAAEAFMLVREVIN